MKELFVILTFIVLLVGVPYTLASDSSLAVVGATTVATLYCIGVLALDTFHKSFTYKNRKTQYVALLLGFGFVLVAHFSLTTLLRGR